MEKPLESFTEVKVVILHYENTPLAKSKSFHDGEKMASVNVVLFHTILLDLNFYHY